MHGAGANSSLAGLLQGIKQRPRFRYAKPCREWRENLWISEPKQQNFEHHEQQ
jgi:hypothetical protein